MSANISQIYSRLKVELELSSSFKTALSGFLSLGSSQELSRFGINKGDKL